MKTALDILAGLALGFMAAAIFIYVLTVVTRWFV